VDEAKNPVVETPDPSGSALTASPERADERYTEIGRRDGQRLRLIIRTAGSNPL